MHWPTPMPTLRLRPAAKSAALRSRASNSRCREPRKNSTRAKPPASLKPAAETIVAADHIVFVFPLWLGTLPALSKAFLEQVIRPGVAFSYEKYGRNCWLAAPRISLSPWGCRPGCIRHSFAATAFAGCAETCSNLRASRRSGDVRHGRERVRRDKIPLVGHHAQEWRESALTVRTGCTRLAAATAPARSRRSYPSLSCRTHH
jgi:hypothetical protein